MGHVCDWPNKIPELLLRVHCYTHKYVKCNIEKNFEETHEGGGKGHAKWCFF